jgi:hypothetical protein
MALANVAVHESGCWPAPADCGIAAKSAAFGGTPAVTAASSARRHLTHSCRLPRIKYASLQCQRVGVSAHASSTSGVFCDNRRTHLRRCRRPSRGIRRQDHASGSRSLPWWSTGWVPVYPYRVSTLRSGAATGFAPVTRNLDNHLILKELHMRPTDSDL